MSKSQALKNSIFMSKINILLGTIASVLGIINWILSIYYLIKKNEN